MNLNPYWNEDEGPRFFAEDYDDTCARCGHTGGCANFCDDDPSDVNWWDDDEWDGA